MNFQTGAADLAAENTATPDDSVVYKQTPQGELRLYRFISRGQEGNAPAIVFFFGGGWVGGTPTQFYPFADHLAARGMQCYCAEYRVESRHGTTPRSCAEDGVSAVRWLRGHAESEGIDPEHIAAGGGSAGGQMAAVAATCRGFDTPGEDSSISCRPDALVLYNPVYDNGPDGAGHDRVAEYWEQISPMHNIDGKIPPTIVLLGTEDPLIPVATAKLFKEKSEAVGGYSELHLYDGESHGFFNYGKAPYEDCRDRTVAFFQHIEWIKE